MEDLNKQQGNQRRDPKPDDCGQSDHPPVKTERADVGKLHAQHNHQERNGALPDELQTMIEMAGHIDSDQFEKQSEDHRVNCRQFEDGFDGHFDACSAARREVDTGSIHDHVLDDHEKDRIRHDAFS